MKPRINTPDGIAAIKAFAASVEHMPKDIQGWGTPQIYPFWASGQAYSAMSFPSIIGFAESNPNSVIKGKQIACLIPGNMIDGKLVRRAPQAAGTGYMVSAYSKTSGARLPVHPVVHQPERRRRGGRPSSRASGIRSACRI